MATIKKACKGVSYPKSSNVSKRLGSPSKAKSGGSFPDLNKDGKITKKDVLIGRGVLPKTAKKGMMVKKAQTGKKVNPTYEMQLEKFRKSNEYKDYQNKVEKYKKENPGKPIVIPGTIKTTPKSKMGGKTKKCAYGCK